MNANKVIVIGGGASGLMASGQAAQQGAEAFLLEKMERPGRKLAITGKGRCNLTNITPLLEFIDHFGPNGRFLHQAFNRFFTADLIEFFDGLGVKTVVERGRRVFPRSGYAPEVRNALEEWIAQCGVQLKTEVLVKRLIVEQGRVRGVETSSSESNGKRSKNKKSMPRDVYWADSIIIATGGASYPATGSTGDGYKLAESVGHSVVTIRPALVPLETAGETAKRLQGVSLRNVLVRIQINRKTTLQKFGEMIFLDSGISGPVILSVSRNVVDALRMNQRVEISIDLKPALDDGRLDLRLLRDFKKNGKRKFSTLLQELLPQKLIPVCIDSTGISPEKRGNQITTEERKRLRLWLKNFRLDVSGYRPFPEAIITAGGVNINEVDPRTMASRLVKGLYFSGEVLDMDADTGGYNLQAAFSTGWLAGRSAAVGGVPTNKL